MNRVIYCKLTVIDWLTLWPLFISLLLLKFFCLGTIVHISVWPVFAETLR